MATRRWADAVRHYNVALAHKPDNGAIWVQYAHALKELGELDRAAESYARAIALNPRDIDARLHRAYTLRRQDLLADAIEEFAAIMEVDPDHHEAQAMLIQSGARHRVPQSAQRADTAVDMATLREQLTQLGRRVDRWIDLSTYPLTNYNGFRQDYAIKPPPRSPVNLPSIDIEIDARDTAPFLLRATLLSLLEQTDEEWHATVHAGEATAAHPVASLAADARIDFSGRASSADYVLHVSAGTILHEQALSWFRFALGRTGARAAWCDFDHATEHWRDRRHHDGPQLWGVFDIDLMAQAMIPPAAVAVRRDALPVTDEGGMESRRRLLIDASRHGPVVHVPRILASVLRSPELARGAPAAAAIERADHAAPLPGPVAGTAIVLQARDRLPCVSVGAPQPQRPRIQVIIPTRDAHEMLETACSTLLTLAASPERITLTIIDNRSTEPETARLLARLAEQPNIDVVPLDEPFNWSRANNVGMRASDAELVVFANNDIEMLTHGWDDLLAGYLARPDIGAVGCRLLYPDASLQHGGILFGLGEGPPIHDGARVEEHVTGPQHRYILTHRAAAVTGAFLATRRDVFDRVGGFDEVGLAIAYNDVDFCLNVRALGLGVLYAPAIELVHLESKTRGVADVATKVAWDLGELRTLHERWGDGLLTDPGYNPQWSADRPFDGFRNPTLLQILEHIDRSAASDPWTLSPVASITSQSLPGTG